MMGDSFEMEGAPTLHVKVLGTSRITSVEIIKDATFAHRIEPNAETVEFDYTDAAPANGQSWYYVRVIQADRNMAWSSPVWITRK
jgi:hypothetical protein